MAEDKKEGRFIRSGSEEFHSVRAERSAEEEVTEISSFADRLTTHASASHVHTGYTGKLNTYDAAHSAGSKRGKRMIRPQNVREVPDEEITRTHADGAAAAAAEERPVRPAAAPPAEAAAEPAAEPADDGAPAFSFDAATAAAAADSPEDVRVFVSPAAEVPPAAPAAPPAAPGAADPTPTAVFTSPDAPDPAAESPTRHIAGGGDVEAKGARLRRIAGSAEDDVRRNPDQLMMEGFQDDTRNVEEEELRRQEAGELEQALSRSREKLLRTFKARRKSEPNHQDSKFSAEEEQDGADLPGALRRFADRFAKFPNRFAAVKSEEYTDYNERKPVFSALMEARRNTLLRMLVIALLGVVLLLINWITHGSAVKNNGVFTVFGGSDTVFLTVNLVFLVLTALCMLPELKSGVLSALKVTPASDTLLTAMLGAAVLQNITGFFTSKLASDYRLLTPSAILLCLPYLAAKLFYYDSTRHCFKAISNRSDKSYLRSVSDPALVSRLLCERADEKSNIVYPGKTRFVSGLLRRSAAGAFDVMPRLRTVFLCVALSLVAAVVGGIVKGETAKDGFAYAFTALSFCLQISLPVCGITACGWMLSKENEALSRKSSFILRYTDAHDFSAVDNIAVDASDLFKADVVGCMTAKGVREKQAHFVAAAVAKQAGGLMGSLFSGDIAAFGEKLPASDNTVYEEKLGLSAWVNGCKVLLGTRALLDHHSAELPSEEEVLKGRRQGDLPVYLAMEGHFTAVFYVRYQPKPSIAEGLGALVERGTNLLIATNDANISERFAEQALSLPADCVRMVGSAAAEQLAEARAVRGDAEEAGVVFDDSVSGMCRCACAAVRLRRTQKLMQLFSNFGAYAMLALGLILTVSGAFAKLSSIVPVLLQCAWIALCFAVMILTNRGKAAAAPEGGRFAKSAPAAGRQAGRPSAAGADTAEESAAAQAAENAVPAEASPDAEPVPENGGSQPAAPPRHAEEDAVYEVEVPVRAHGASERPVQREKAAAPARVGRAAVKGARNGARTVGKKFRDMLSSLTAGPEDEDDEWEDDPEEGAPADRRPVSRPKKNASPAAPAADAEPSEPFTLYGKGSVRERANDDVEGEYQARKKLAAETRRTFTAPEAPPAPHFDLGAADDDEGVPYASFEPPTGEGTFDEELLRRFEDDRIFAGLYDQDGKRKR